MRISAGNIDGIVREYSEPLYRYIRRLVICHEDAEDILQETFIKAFRKLWQLRDSSSLRPWLYRIATNEVNKFFSSRKMEAGLEEALLERLEASEYVNLQDIAGRRLQEAVIRLSPLQRTVFNLRYYDEMNYDQISQVTGSKPETLKVVWHNARKKVEEYLKMEI